MRSCSCTRLAAPSPSAHLTCDCCDGGMGQRRSSAWPDPPGCPGCWLQMTGVRSVLAWPGWASTCWFGRHPGAQLGQRGDLWGVLGSGEWAGKALGAGRQGLVVGQPAARVVKGQGQLMEFTLSMMGACAPMMSRYLKPALGCHTWVGHGCDFHVQTRSPALMSIPCKLAGPSYHEAHAPETASLLAQPIAP